MADDQPPRTTAPPQNLRFVVANDPDQFRDRSTMRSNRSHVMHNHLSEKRHGGSSRTAAEGSKVLKRTRSTTPSRTGDRGRSPSLSQASLSLEQPALEQTISSSEALAIFRRTQDPKPRRRTTGKSSGDSRSRRGDSSRSPSLSLHSPGLISRPGSVPLVSSPPLMPIQQPSGLLYCEDEELAAAINEALVQWPTQSTVGWGSQIGAQALSIRPQITIDMLQYHCLGTIRETGSAFHTSQPFQPKNWISLMGALTLASPDMVIPSSPLSEASSGTNAEAMEILQQSFRDPSNVTDATAMAVLFLVCHAIVNFNESLARVHEEGLLRILQLRGGLQEMRLNQSNAILSIISLSALVTDRQLDGHWIEYRDTVDRSVIRGNQQGPQSPLLYPGSGFGILFDSTACQERTHNVLRSACQLTSLAAELVGLRTTQIFSPGFSTQSQSIQRLTNVTRSVGEIAAAIHAINQSSLDNDYVFEACRITAAIYATSIQRRVFFQQAADIVHDENIHANPVQSLVHALQMTDVAGCWDNMCGVLLWITLVGGIAAQDQQARSWLLSISMRCCIVLLVEKGDAVVESLKSLLVVTQLWVEGGSSVFA